MSRYFVIFLVLVAILTVRPPLLVAQEAGPRLDADPQFLMPRILPAPHEGQIANRRPDPQPDYSLRVWVVHTINDDQSNAGKETASLQNRVKDLMNKARLGVPEDRIRYFEPLWQNNTPISGWAGMISKVAPIKGGYAVTLQITAVEGGGVHDNTHLYEHYTIVGSKVKYRGFTEPAPYLRVRGG